MIAAVIAIVITVAVIGYLFWETYGLDDSGEE
jgi:hypothetical protein